MIGWTPNLSIVPAHIAPTLSLAPSGASGIKGLSLSSMSTFDMGGIMSVGNSAAWLGMPGSVGSPGVGFGRFANAGMSGMWGVGYQAPRSNVRAAVMAGLRGGTLSALSYLTGSAYRTQIWRKKYGTSVPGGIPQVRDWAGEARAAIAERAKQRAADKTKKSGGKDGADGKGEEEAVTREQRIKEMTDKGISAENAKIFYERYLKGKKTSAQDSVMDQVYEDKDGKKRDAAVQIQIMADAILKEEKFPEGRKRNRLIMKASRREKLSVLPKAAGA